MTAWPPERLALDTQSLPYVLALSLIIGSGYIASRFGLGQVSPITFLSVNLGIASAGYALTFLLTKRRWPTDRRLWRHGMVYGTLGYSLPVLLNLIVLQYLSGGLTSILATLNPAFVVLLAHVFLPDEPLTGRKAGGVGLALSGAVLMGLLGESGLPDVSRGSPLAYLMMLAVTLIWSGSMVYARRYLKEFDVTDVASVRIFCATAVMIPITLLAGGVDLSRATRLGLLALGYHSVFITFTSQLLSFYIIKRFGVTPAALIDYIAPIVASLGGVLLLGEQITPGVLAGVALIFVGLSLVNRRGRPAQTAEGVP